VHTFWLNTQMFQIFLYFQAIHDNMKIQCKCHGVSGSCELKTCWKATPSFREIGGNLKEKFDGATEVEQKRIGTRRQLMPINKQYKPHTTGDLVYIDASPDFCEPDKETGSLGTHGRLCDKNSKAIDGCDLMCCGRGFKTRKRTVVERCNCKFYWCCYVKCKECRKEVEEHRCIWRSRSHAAINYKRDRTPGLLNTEDPFGLCSYTSIAMARRNLNTATCLCYRLWHSMSTQTAAMLRQRWRVGASFWLIVISVLVKQGYVPHLI
jgi:hypothetical protein